VKNVRKRSRSKRRSRKLQKERSQERTAKLRVAGAWVAFTTALCSLLNTVVGTNGAGHISIHLRRPSKSSTDRGRRFNLADLCKRSFEAQTCLPLRPRLRHEQDVGGLATSPPIAAVPPPGDGEAVTPNTADGTGAGPAASDATAQTDGARLSSPPSAPVAIDEQGSSQAAAAPVTSEKTSSAGSQAQTVEDSQQIDLRLEAPAGTTVHITLPEPSPLPDADCAE
jgi:hypothetical protein